MSTWKRFWMAVVGWSAALLFLLAVYSLLVHFTSESYRGPGAIVLALHSVARALGLFFPLIVFSAALGARLSSPTVQRMHGLPAVTAAPIAAGALEYVWLAWVEPWSRIAIFGWSAGLAGATIDPAPVASTQVWLATQLSNPALDSAEERFFSWLFHLPIALGLLTALLGLVGLVIGRRAATGPQRWSMAALVSLVVAPMLLASLRLSTRYQVPAEATTYGMLVVPLLLLAVVGWIGWTDRERVLLAASA